MASNKINLVSVTWALSIATSIDARKQVMALKFNSFIDSNMIDTVKVPSKALNERYAKKGAGC